MSLGTPSLGRMEMEDKERGFGKVVVIILGDLTTQMPFPTLIDERMETIGRGCYNKILLW